MRVWIGNLGKKCVVGAMLVLSASLSASDKLAPSRTQAACEKLLIWSGLWHPQTRATIHREGPELVDSNYRIRVHHDDVPETVTFNRTDRGFSSLREEAYYPGRFLKLDYFKNKRVLDLACGDGKFVEELRRAGVDAVGLDVFLGRYQKSKPYFVQASADDTGLPAGSADLIVSTQGPISYLYDSNPEVVRKILLEARRVLRKGGTLLISSIDIHIDEPKSYWPEDLAAANIDPKYLLRNTLFANLPEGLKIKSAPDRDWIFYWNTYADEDFYRATPGVQTRYWLELERTD